MKRGHGMKMTKGTLIGFAVVLAVLAASFFLGGSRPPAEAGNLPPVAPSTVMPVPTARESHPLPDTPSPTPSPPPSATAVPTVVPTVAASEHPAPSVSADISAEAVPQASQPPVAPEPSTQATPSAAEPGEEALTCTLSISCATVLERMEELEESKRDLIPEDGMLFPATEVTFYEGESVFEALRREMKANRIHLEFVEAPLYQSAYIEGIGNLYEFDCGELSGWVYRVNGSFPSYGSSQYQLQNGDTVEWLYSCDLGRDVGGNNGWGGVKD